MFGRSVFGKQLRSAAARPRLDLNEGALRVTRIFGETQDKWAKLSLYQRFEQIWALREQDRAISKTEPDLESSE